MNINRKNEILFQIALNENGMVNKNTDGINPEFVYVCSKVHCTQLSLSSCCSAVGSFFLLILLQISKCPCKLCVYMNGIVNKNVIYIKINKMDSSNCKCMASFIVYRMENVQFSSATVRHHSTDKCEEILVAEKLRYILHILLESSGHGQFTTIA